MKMAYMPAGAGRRRRMAGIAMIVVAVAVIGAVGLAPQRAMAHGGGDEAGAVDLVEQALAIVVNSPEAVGEAIERVEAALTEEAEEPTGDLDVASLEVALAALEAGDLHDAEDALVAALGIDPHADEDEVAETVQESPVGAVPDTTAQGSADAGVTADADETGVTEDPVDEAQPVETAAVSTDTLSHGLTDRVDGGFRAPSGTGIAALVLAGALAAGGFVLAYSRTGGK